MSTVISKNVQVGNSGTAAQNFTWYQPASPDGTVRLGVGNSGVTTGDVITANSSGVTVTGTLTATTLSGSLGAATATSLTVNGNNISAVNSLGFRNRIINGDMRIDQRNAGASVTPTDGQYTLDRWAARLSQASKYSVQQNGGAVTPPAGFSNYLGVTSLSAYSVTSTDYFMLQQGVEGFNVADLGWGTANAQAITISFWVRSSLTGTFGGCLQNNASVRSYPFTYTISASNTWEQKFVNIAGDTSGTWLTNNGNGIILYMALGMGSSRSGTANSWNAGNTLGVSGATSVVGTNGATFYITGVQLEAGSVASPFERRDYGRELIMCQRYYYKIGPGITNSMLGVGWNASTTQSLALTTFPVTMRAAPSALEQTGTAGDYSIYHGAGSGTACSSVPSFSIANTTNARTLLTVASGLTANGGSMARAETTNGYFAWSAEL
jgi:hypothetical protein